MEIINVISTFAVPGIMFMIVLAGIIRKLNVFDTFVTGAKESLEIIIRILPSLVGLLVGIGMFRASGAMDMLINLIKPVTSFIGIPVETVPLALMRPVSGSGSIALVADIFKTYGTDSLIGRISSVMMGATETTFYTLAVYFSVVSAKNTRHSLKAALCGDLTGVIASVWICRILFKEL